MLNVKSVACVFREMARVYCAFKERSHLLDYYHCYSFLVDNYLKKQNKKPFFLSITIGSRTLTLTLTLTLRTFSTLFRSICPFPCHYSLPHPPLLPSLLWPTSTLFPFHFPHSCSPPISSSLVHFLFFFTSPSN